MNTDNAQEPQKEAPTQDDKKVVKPSFEQWVVEGVISQREDKGQIMADLLFTALMGHIHMTRKALLEVSKDAFGKHPEDSDEFKKAQEEWWHFYERMMVLRSFLLRIYRFPLPNWDELLPEREYIGVVLSEEDFKKFVTKPPKGSGLQKMKGESMDTLEKSIIQAKDNDENTEPFLDTD